MSELEFECTLARPLYEYNDKKYINLQLDDTVTEKINKIQYVSVQINPLVDNTLKVKLPFRYKKFEFRMIGAKTIYELNYDDPITVRIKYCGVWKLDGFSGHAWKVISIEYIDPP